MGRCALSSGYDGIKTALAASKGEKVQANVDTGEITNVDDSGPEAPGPRHGAVQERIITGGVRSGLRATGFSLGCPKCCWIVETLQRVILGSALHEFSWRAVINRVGHQDLAGPSRGLRARGSVHHGADCSEVVVCPAEFSEMDLATIDAYANADSFLINGSRSREGRAPHFAALLNFARREQGLAGMVVMANRKIENGHDCVAHCLVEQAVVIPNGLGTFVIEGVKHL
jgi:hypothetical protein